MFINWSKVRPSKAITDPISPCEQELIEEEKRRICLNRVIISLILNRIPSNSLSLSNIFERGAVKNYTANSESDPAKFFVPFEY